MSFLPGIGAAGLFTKVTPLVQVAFGAAGAGATTNTDNLQVPYPTGIVAGSFLVAHALAFTATFNAAPAGWTDESAGLGLVGNDIAFWWRIADGSESGSLSMQASGVARVGRMYRFSHGTGIESRNVLQTTSGDTTIEAADITTLGPKRMAVQLMLGLANTTIGSIAGESGAAYAESVAEFAGGSPGNFCLSCQDAGVTVAGAITGGSATFGASVANQSTVGFAIVP